MLASLVSQITIDEASKPAARLVLPDKVIDPTAASDDDAVPPENQ
jgi:hypothetical protein